MLIKYLVILTHSFEMAAILVLFFDFLPPSLAGLEICQGGPHDL